MKSFSNTHIEIPKRLTPKTATIRLLLAKSGNQCAFENCTEVIFNDAGELVSECCHIEAAEPGGERFNMEQSNEERRSFNNLVFLCHKHHIETNNIDVYTTPKLREIKQLHHDKFSEKQIHINPNYIDSVIDKFNEISFKIDEAIEVIKKVESKQDSLFELFNTNNNRQTISEINEFFGQPAFTNFIGRKDELRKFKNNFKKFNTIIVQGLSGIGKSNLVSSFVDTIKKHQIFWVKCDIVKNKESFLVTLSDFLIQKFKDNSLKKCLSESNEVVINNSLIYLLNKYPICLIFDALNNSIHELFLCSQILNASLNNSKIIITTTEEFDIISWTNHPYKIQLKGMSVESFAQLCELYGLTEINNNDFNSLYTLTGGHPYLLKLLASLSSYQPISELIGSLNCGGKNDYEDYINKKIISELNIEEKKLLSYILILDIPFRYLLGDYLIDVSYTSSIKSLQQKFLIEKFGNDHFIIPEFIKLNIQKFRNELGKNLNLNLLIKYLKNIKEPRIIEKIGLINLALKTDKEESAKVECRFFISNLMGSGYFNLVIKYVNDLISKNPNVSWDFLFYVLGRVYRMQKQYKKALQIYNKGIELNPNSEIYSHFLFEKASILTYLSEIEGQNNYLEQAKRIYDKLSLSQIKSISIQSQISISRIFVNEGKQKKAIKKINSLIDAMDFKNLDNYVAAQIWHSQGDAFSEDCQYKKAFESFDIGIDYYKKAIEKNGLNGFEGLYHLYISYGTTYSNAKDYISAAEMFQINVSLAKQFGLERKLESALLDYGYHLVLSKQFDEAVEVLNEHHSLINRNNTVKVSELPFLYRCLMFSFWYSNNFLNSIELLGLYVNASLFNNKKPLITILETINKNESFDVIEFFKKGMNTLILPEDKKFDDLKKWIDEVCLKKPELTSSLHSFFIFKKPD